MLKVVRRKVEREKINERGITIAVNQGGDLRREVTYSEYQCSRGSLLGHVRFRLRPGYGVQGGGCGTYIRFTYFAGGVVEEKGEIVFFPI